MALARSMPDEQAAQLEDVEGLSDYFRTGEIPRFEEFYESLGSPERTDALAHVPLPVFEDLMKSWYDTSIHYPTHISTILAWRLGARQMEGLPVDPPPMPQLIPPTQPRLPPPGEAAEGAPATRLKKVKLSLLTDPSNEADLVELPNKRLDALWETYERTQGCMPPPERQPTKEQISAVRQTIDLGEPPYVSFSVFGPWGARALDVEKSKEFVPLPNGTWKTTTNKGPLSGPNDS